MQNQQLFEAPFVSEASKKSASTRSNSATEKCMCRSCQGKAASRSHPNSETQWLFESPPQSDRELLGGEEAMASLSGGAGWFWQALGEAHLALKSAMTHLKSRNLSGARQSIETARQRLNLAGKTLGSLKSQKTLKDSLAHGHVAIQKTQRLLSAQNVDIAAALAELRKAVGAIGAAMRLALKARNGAKVWN
jgi:hypothetical protein